MLEFKNGISKISLTQDFFYPKNSESLLKVEVQAASTKIDVKNAGHEIDIGHGYSLILATAVSVFLNWRKKHKQNLIDKKLTREREDERRFATEAQNKENEKRRTIENLCKIIFTPGATYTNPSANDVDIDSQNDPNIYLLNSYASFETHIPDFETMWLINKHIEEIRSALEAQKDKIHQTTYSCEDGDVFEIKILSLRKHSISIFIRIEVESLEINTSWSTKTNSTKTEKK